MNERRELLVGFVIIVAVVVGVAGTLWMQGSSFGRPTTTVEALLSSVGQLNEGNPVTYRGVRIGTVDGIAVEDGGTAVRITLRLQEDVALPSDAALVLGPESLFGDWQAEVVSRANYERFPFHEIPPGTAPVGLTSTGPVLPGYALPELSRLTASAEQISLNLADLTDRLELAFNQETADNLARAITNIEAITQEVRTLVQTQGELAGRIVANADSTLTEVETAATAARTSFERIDGLLDDAQVDSILVNMAAATRGLAQISADLADEDAGLAATLERADSAFVRVDRLAQRIEAGEGSLGRLITDTTLAVRAEGVLLQLDLLLQDVRENPRRYVRLSIF